MGRVVLIAGLLVTAAASCADPVVDDRIDALGPEDPNVPEGPAHRPGQPCLACHDGTQGPRRFSFGGTVHAIEGEPAVAPGVLVELVDVFGDTHRVVTNCAGNFFVEPADYDPTFPVWVALEFDGDRVEMESPIGRDGSCATCHGPRPDRRSAGPVYFDSFELQRPEVACP